MGANLVTCNRRAGGELAVALREYHEGGEGKKKKDNK